MLPPLEEGGVSQVAMDSTVLSPPILVVEDDEDTRDALRDLLAGQNYPVLDASNGQEALRVLDRTRPALIIMDLSMPVMNGWQLLDFIHQKSLLAGVPIIVLSSDSKPPSADVCFLQTPVGAEHLLEAVSERLCH